MNIKEKIAALSEISPRTVIEVLTFEDFRFEILDIINTKELNFTELEGLFLEVHKIIQDMPFNIINERIAFKTFFLTLGYGLDIDFANAMICSAPLLQIDFELSKILKDIEFYVYYEEMYKEFKSNMELNFKDMLQSIEDLDLESYVKEVEGVVNNLKDVASPKN